MMTEVEGFSDAIRLVDLIIETIWYGLEHSQPCLQPCAIMLFRDIDADP